MATVVKYILDIDTKKSAQALKDLAKVTEDLDKDLSLVKKAGSSAKTGLDDTSKGMKGLTKAANPLSLSLGKVKDTALQMANTLVTATKEVFNFVTEAVDAVNRLNDMATASGLAAETIQAVELAFRASGQAASAGDTILKKFPQRMADIRKKGSEASQIIKSLGIEIRDTAGNFRDSDSVFKDIIRNLQGIEDQELKTAAAQKIFKRDVGNLLVALGNSGPLERFIKFTKNFGVDAKKSASQAATFQQRIAALSIAFSFARDRIVAAFGGMQAFNGLLLESVGAVVFAAEMVRLFSGEFITLGKIITSLLKLQFKSFFDVLKGLNLLKDVGFIDNLANDIQRLSGAKAGAGFLQNFSARIQQAKSSASEAKKELSDFGKNIELSGDDAKIATEKMKRLKDAIDKLFGEGDKGAEGQKKSTQDLQKEQDRAIAKFKELKAVFNDGDTSAKAALKSTNKLIRVFDRLQIPIKDLKAFQTVLKQKINTAELEKFQAKQAAAQKKFDELKASFDAGNISAEKALAKAVQMTGAFEDLKLPTEEVNSFTESLRKLQEQAEKIKTIESRIQIFADITGAAAAGDGPAIAKILSDMLGLLPEKISGAIVGAFGAIEELGKKTPEEMIEEGRQRNEAIANGIAMLPRVLLEVFPQLLLDLAFRIVQGFIKAIFTIPTAIKNSFGELGKMLIEFFSKPGEAIREGFSNFRNFIFSFGGQKLGGGPIHFPAGQGGLRFTGQQRGLAMLHEGEVVTPRSGRMSQGLQRRFQGGQAPNIVINSAVVDGNVIDTLVRQIEEKFLTFGTSQSTLFGGA